MASPTTLVPLLLLVVAVLLLPPPPLVVQGHRLPRLLLLTPRTGAVPQVQVDTPLAAEVRQRFVPCMATSVGCNDTVPLAESCALP